MSGRLGKLLTIALAILLGSSGIAATVAIVALYLWGGQIETQLLLFGDRVWVTMDAGRPRLLLLFGIPAVLFWTAAALTARIRRDRPAVG